MIIKLDINSKTVYDVSFSKNDHYFGATLDSGNM